MHQHDAIGTELAFDAIEPQHRPALPFGDRLARIPAIDIFARRIDRARAARAPVVWIQHSGPGLEEGSTEWEYVKELTRLESEPLVHKRYGDSFADTDLEERLAELGVGKLVVSGAQTDMCIRSTLHGALTRGYDATLVGDAHGTEDMREWGAPMGPMDAVAYTNLYWSESRTHEATGGVKPPRRSPSVEV